jgi:hypothetical protein
MIFAVAAAAALTTSRAALAQRWLHANHAHSAARLEPTSASAAPPHDLSALAQREFAIVGRYRLSDSPPAPAAEPWWSRPLRWLGARLAQLRDALFTRVHVGRAAAASVGDVLLVVVGLLLFFVVVRLLRNLQIRRATSRLAYRPMEAPPDPQALYDDARRAASAGEYGTAALLLFAAMVALLDGRGLVENTRSATVGELRRELRSSDAGLISRFDAIAAPFVAKAYAERVVEAPQWDRAHDAFAALLQERAQP